jgi:hypothetical protein
MRLATGGKARVSGGIALGTIWLLLRGKLLPPRLVAIVAS